MITLILPLSPSVRPLLRPVATMARTPSKYFLIVAATFLNCRSRERDGQLIHSRSLSRTSWTWRLPRISASDSLSRYPAVESAVGALKLREPLPFQGRQVPWALEQEPSGLLERPALPGIFESPHLRASQFVQGVLGEALDVEPVEDDLGLRGPCGHRIDVGGGHVDGDGLELCRALRPKTSKNLPRVSAFFPASDHTTRWRTWSTTVVTYSW